MVIEYRRNLTITADGVTEIHETDKKLYTEHYTWEEWKNLLLECHSPPVFTGRRLFHCKHECRGKNGEPMCAQKARLNTHRWHGCPRNVDANGTVIPEKMYPNLLEKNVTIDKLLSGFSPQRLVREYVTETQDMLRRGEAVNFQQGVPAIRGQSGRSSPKKQSKKTVKGETKQSEDRLATKAKAMVLDSSDSETDPDTDFEGSDSPLVESRPPIIANPETVPTPAPVPIVLSPPRRDTSGSEDEATEAVPDTFAVVPWAGLPPRAPIGGHNLMTKARKAVKDPEDREFGSRINKRKKTPAQKVPAARSETNTTASKRSKPTEATPPSPARAETAVSVTAVSGPTDDSEDIGVEPMVVDEAIVEVPLSPMSALMREKEKVEAEARKAAESLFRIDLLPQPETRLGHTGLTILMDYGLFGEEREFHSWDRTTLRTRLGEFLENEGRETMTSVTYGRFQKLNRKVRHLLSFVFFFFYLIFILFFVNIFPDSLYCLSIFHTCLALQSVTHAS